MRLIYKEGGRSHSYYIQKGLNSIGRSPKSCDLVLFDSSVSKKHVELHYNKKRKEVVIKDLGSSNGTLINGQRIREVVLSDSDVIKIGQTKLLFTICDEDMSETEVDRIFGMGEEKLEAAALRPFLRIEDEEGSQTFPLGLENITIGHKSGNDIIISGTGVSRFHAEIYFDDNSWWIKDLKSKNGTYVAGVKLEEDRELQERDVIQIGSSFITFEFPREQTIVDRFGNLEPKVKIPLVVGTVFILSCVLYFLFAGGKPPEKKVIKVPVARLIDDGLRYLIKEQYPEATHYFKKVRLEHNYESLDLFAQISSYLDLGTLKDSKLTPLEQALKRLKTLVLKEAPKDNERILSYLDRKIKLVKKEKDNYARFQRASALAGSHELSKKEQAYELFQKIDEGSKFFSEAKKFIIQLKEEIRKQLVQEARYYMNEVDPNWLEAIKRFQKALQYGKNDTTFEIEVNTWIRQCQKERINKENLEQGGRYYENGEFPLALQYLGRVTGDSVWYYKKALGLIQLIKAQNRLADAERLYEQGEGVEALKKLQPLNSTKAIILKKKIAQVVQYMNLGEKAKEVRDFVEAMRWFTKLLQIEKSGRNTYHISAKNLSSECRAAAEGGLRQIYKEGISALEREEYGKSLANFEKMVKNDFTNKYRGMIEREIRSRADELLSAAKQIQIQGRKRLFSKAKSICKLLKIFLAPDDLRRDKAIKILQELY